MSNKILTFDEFNDRLSRLCRPTLVSARLNAGLEAEIRESHEALRALVGVCMNHMDLDYQDTFALYQELQKKGFGEKPL